MAIGLLFQSLPGVPYFTEMVNIVMVIRELLLTDFFVSKNSIPCLARQRKRAILRILKIHLDESLRKP